MERLYERGGLASALRDARARTLALYGHLDLAAVEFPRLAVVNPAPWELAHIAWFQEYWCLRRRDAPQATRESMLEGADALYDSAAVPHDARWDLPYPAYAQMRAYLEETLEATLAALEQVPEEALYFFALAVLHEDMHGEALLMTLHTLGLPAPHGVPPAPPSEPMPASDVAFEGGGFEFGTSPGAPHFVFDNEKWAHAVHVAPFAIANRPTTQGEFAAFVEEGGYTRRELWSAAGWAWRESLGRTMPRDWRREDGGWVIRRFDQARALDPHAPVMHLSLHEAQAWCRWAKRRLPTEIEWEYAARNGGGGERYPWGDEPRELACLDLASDGPALDGQRQGARGLGLVLGGVWEWTASTFGPYPGFAPDPYREYSQPWFGDHAVLRGGSFATRARLAHNRLRNFYRPERDDAFAGMRTCAAE